MSLSTQWLTLGAMLLSGIGMGVLFDGYRVVSNELRFPRWSLSVLDLLYWIASAIIVFRMLYVSNSGEVRAYVFVGLAIGAILYYMLFSKLTMTITLWLIKAGKWCIRIITNIFHLLLIKPIILMWVILRYVAIISYKFSIGLGKIVLQLLRPVVNLLLWVISPITKPLIKWLIPKWKNWRTPKQLTLLWHTLKRFWLRRK